MIVPTITIAENISESIKYFPANVCGLEIGELFIPETVVAIINIPEITVPDFAECPFYVVLPPPIYYASSVYPIYENDGLLLSTDLVSMHFGSVNTVNATEGVSVYSTINSGDLIQFNYLDLFNQIESVMVESSVVGGTLIEYRFVDTEVLEESLYLESELLSISMQTYRYIDIDNYPVESVSIESRIISGSLI